VVSAANWSTTDSGGGGGDDGGGVGGGGGDDGGRWRSESCRQWLDCWLLYLVMAGIHICMV